MDRVEIEIINWDKYNPKRDQQTYTWLRMDNSISVDPDLFGLDAAQKFVWVCILCEASKKNSGTVSLTIGYLSHVTGVKESKIKETLKFLERKPVVRLHDNARSPDVASTTPTNERTNERTNVTNERDETNERAPAVADGRETFDFESLYQKYPLKKGKEAGIKSARDQIRSPEDFEALSKAIDRYTVDLKAHGTEVRFIKHFSSFIGTKRTGFPWRDWTADDAGQTSILPAGPQNHATKRAAGNAASLAAYKARLRGLDGST